MKTLNDPDHALAAGLATIRTQFQVPDRFPDAVLAAADIAAQRRPTAHQDWTARDFVTLDPASSTDLDQAFAIEPAGNDLILHYAIADVAWFVDDGDVIDVEAWQRGTTIYLPDGKAPLYPPILSQGATSLLPDGPRPAVVFTVRIDPAGDVRLDQVTRAIIHSRAKLAYDAVRDSDLPDGFIAIAARMHAAELRRGAARIDPPEQEIARGPDGHYALQFRPRLVSEDRNAALSLATNMAVATALQAHQTGLFRVMPEPDGAAIQRLRQTALAFGVDWSATETLDLFERRLDATDPKQAALMMAIRRAGARAGYVPYRPGETPWHAAMAAPYAHATAPLRRLADRYVVQAALAVTNGLPVPAAVTDAFGRLPPVMARADALSGRIDRAAIDLAEIIMLQGAEGRTFCAIITDVDERGVRIQLCDLPVVARLPLATDAPEQPVPGQRLSVRLVTTDPVKRTILFERATAP